MTANHMIGGRGRKAIFTARKSNSLGLSWPRDLRGCGSGESDCKCEPSRLFSIDTGVAQLAERWSPKPKVRGSIPFARACLFRGEFASRMGDGCRRGRDSSGLIAIIFVASVANLRVWFVTKWVVSLGVIHLNLK